MNNNYDCINFTHFTRQSVIECRLICAKEVVNKPIFLAAGHDRGITRAKLIALMLQEKSQTINKISGFIDLEYQSLVVRLYNLQLYHSSTKIGTV
jgi:hypothetical protein